jgi:hypothetical protein
VTGLDNERFYPATPDEVFTALHAAAGRLFKVKGADQFSRAVTFTTPAAGFSWGATMSAQVIPLDGGAYVRVGGAARVRTNITAKGAEYKNTIKLLDAVSAFVQQQRTTTPAKTSPKSGWYPDTQRPGGLRYWDGNAWTEHRQTAADAPPAPQ